MVFGVAPVRNRSPEREVLRSASPGSRPTRHADYSASYVSRHAATCNDNRTRASRGIPGFPLFARRVMTGYVGAALQAATKPIDGQASLKNSNSLSATPRRNQPATRKQIAPRRTFGRVSRDLSGPDAEKRTTVGTVPKGRCYQSPGQDNASAASVDAALGTRIRFTVATTWRP